MAKAGRRKATVAYHYRPTNHVVMVTERADTTYAEAHPDRFTRIPDLAAWVRQKQENGEPIPPSLPPGLIWDEAGNEIDWAKISQQAEGLKVCE